MRLKEITEGITIADKILLVILIILSVSGVIFIKKAFPKGVEVFIEADGKPAYKLPLNIDATVPVKGILGDSVVEIKNGKVRMKDSPCPNKNCVHTGWIDRGSIICLPNRVIVTVGSKNKEYNNTVDAISG